MRCLLVIGTRPNLPKAAALLHAAKGRDDIAFSTLHTGQHSGREMFDLTADDLGIFGFDYKAECSVRRWERRLGSQISGVELAIAQCHPDCVVVLGDCDAALAGAIAASRRRIPVAHVEAGLRSGDRAMPEESNRVAIDALSSLLFTSEDSATCNLASESAFGVVHQVGNTMIDTLERFYHCAVAQDPLGLDSQDFALMTLHRRSFCGSAQAMRDVFAAVQEVSKQITVIFPAHPSVKRSMEEHGVKADGVHIVEPLSYLDFLSLEIGALFVMTDSGGVQDETTALSTPCLTIRDTTERPATMELGTNMLVGSRAEDLVQESRRVMRGEYAWTEALDPIPMWDGHAGERIVDVLASELSGH